MIVTEVFKSSAQGLFGSCMTRTVSLGADNERGALPLANGAIDALLLMDLRTIYWVAWGSVELRPRKVERERANFVVCIYREGEG